MPEQTEVVTQTTPEVSGDSPRPTKVRELVVKAWEGELDAEEINQEILRIIREVAEKHPQREARQASKSHMGRQHAHNVYTDTKVATVPMMAKWCNGRHVGPAYLMALAEHSLRLRHSALGASGVPR